MPPDEQWTRADYVAFLVGVVLMGSVLFGVMFALVSFSFLGLR